MGMQAGTESAGAAALRPGLRPFQPESPADMCSMRFLPF